MSLLLPLLVVLILFLPLSESHPFYNDDSLDYYFFEGVSVDFVDWYMNLTQLDSLFNRFVDEAEYYSSNLAAPGMLLMIFHLIVLTRKSMRTSSTNIFLIAITLADLTYQMAELERYVYKKYSALINFAFYYRSDYCYLPVSYFPFASKYYFEVFRDYLNRCSAWWGLVLTVVRSMAITSTNQSLTNMLISARFGWYAVLSVSAGCVIMPILELRAHEIYVFTLQHTGPNCPEYIEAPEYRIRNTDFSISSVATVDVWAFQIVPSVVVAIFTFILIYELVKVQKRSVHMGSERVQTTKINVLVFLLAVCFVFVRGFQAIVTTFSAWGNTILAFRVLIQDKLPIVVSTAFIANAFLHFIICAGLSSQYRETVRRMFNLERMRVRMRIAAGSVTMT